jgi:hypothetical protein
MIMIIIYKRKARKNEQGKHKVSLPTGYETDRVVAIITALSTNLISNRTRIKENDEVKPVNTETTTNLLGLKIKFERTGHQRILRRREFQIKVIPFDRRSVNDLEFAFLLLHVIWKEQKGAAGKTSPKNNR